MLGGASEPTSCLLDKSKRHDFPNPEPTALWSMPYSRKSA